MHPGQLAHELDRVASTGRVLFIAAHPDDENTRLLAHLANVRHVRAAYLSMTRGGGGQNLIGEEQGDLLDVIRTEELLAARDIDGAVQRFTRMRDFGYSKSAEETLATWGHEEALSDVVRVIREFQPDVVMTRFDEKPPNHGHHTASAILGREAFEAAADPARFPEQGLAPWRATRLVQNVPTFREGPLPPGTVSLEIGSYDPRLGLSIGELAALSRSRHQSQGFGVAGDRGKIVEKFLLLGGTPATDEDPILGGIDLTWARYGAAAAPLVAALDEARRLLTRDAPEGALPALFRVRQALDSLPDDSRVRDARAATVPLITEAAGLFVRATAPRPTVVPGGALPVDVEIVARRPVAATLRRIGFPGSGLLETPRDLGTDKVVVSQVVTVPPPAAPPTQHWLVYPPLPGRHVVGDPRLVAEPRPPPALSVSVDVVIGATLSIEVPIVHAWVDPVQGERTRPVLIVPPLSVTPARAAVMLPNGRAGEVVLRVRAGRDDVRGEVEVPLPPGGWLVTPARREVVLAKAGDEVAVSFQVTAPAGAGDVHVRPVAHVDGREWSWSEATIDYPHVPFQLVMRPASVRLVPLTIELPPGRFGHVRGPGDTVAEDLAHVGLPIEDVDDATLRGGDLSKFAGILVGIRAFNTRPEVRAALPRLLEYVERGGTLVVQYNTNNRLAPLSPAPGPYPFEIGRDRITDETAAMTPVNPDHPALRSPNPIGPADFEGWVQERSIYHAASWDERYQPLLTATDPGEQPLPGGTLVAKHGAGRYVYTGLVFFRQLPAGVPGAYRLLANLLAGEPRP